jgi:hypothetical protein
MKRFIPPLITIGLSLLLAVFSAALTYSNPSDAMTNLPAGTYLTHATPISRPAGKSVMGSTDQMVVMGGVISAIIVVPIILKRNAWH